MYPSLNLSTLGRFSCSSYRFRKEFNLSDYPEGVLVSGTKEEQGNEIFCGLRCKPARVY